MKAMVAFCLLTIVFLVYRDLMLPSVRDVEVWFGMEVRGVLAWATAPLHWAIYALGAWIFSRAHPRAWLYAACYAAYIALSHLVWNLSSPSGGGFRAGVIQLGVFLLPAALLFGMHRRFVRSRQDSAQS